MKNNKGISLTTLVITIVVLLILAGISIQTGSKAITSSKLENIKTNMLLVKVKAKEYTENANFKLGTSIDSLSEEEKSSRIEQARNELVGEEIKDGNIFSNNINITTENILSDNSNYIYYYKLSKDNLESMGLKDLKSSEKDGWYIIKYDIKNVQVEIYNTVGFENDGNKTYSLSEIEQIRL